MKKNRNNICYTSFHFPIGKKQTLQLASQIIPITRPPTYQSRNTHPPVSCHPILFIHHYYITETDKALKIVKKYKQTKTKTYLQV